MEKFKPFLRIIVFALVFVLVFVCLSYLAKPIFTDIKIINGFYGEQEDSLDVVYIGGSAAFVYYAPLTAWDEYGIASYVYGANTIQPELYKTLIREVLKTQHPQLIILDARAFQYRDKDSENAQPPAEVPYRNTLNGLRLSMNKIQFIRDNVGTQIDDKKLSYYLDILKYHQNIPDFKEENIQMLLGSYQHPYSGFHFVRKQAPIEQYDFSTTEKTPVSGDTEAILEDLLSYLDSTGVDCLFVVSPYAEKESHKKVFNYISALIQGRGYGFLDFNEYTDEIGLNYAWDFYNEDHVTVFGAEKYTRYLAAFLQNRYDIPNRRNDPNYAFLNDRLPGWDHELLETKDAIIKIVEEQANAQ
ncbi:MAG: hypothetical protein J5789_07355 [Oscillospiraceae bacterium]|nr:hypothetical protein [Oscillospiraceae bacterium]